MVYAQVLKGKIVNTIVVDEKTDLKLFAKGFDDFMRIDDLKYIPGPDWLYDGKDFTRPKGDPDEKTKLPVVKADTKPR